LRRSVAIAVFVIGSFTTGRSVFAKRKRRSLLYVRKKYAFAACETNGDNPRIETAAKPETAIDKGLAGPGLLSYIVTSKFNDYLPCYRLEDIFARQGFEISRATQSVWCGDVGDLAEPLSELMGNEVRASHGVATDDTIMPMLKTGHCSKARMWVYVGDAAHPYNVFDFTLSRGRDGQKYFLQNYNHVLLADAYGGYDGVVAGNAIVRDGCWAHLRREVIEAEKAAPPTPRSKIVCGCARSNRRRCWPSYARSFSTGRSSCCPSIPWPRRSNTLWATGRNSMCSSPTALLPSTTMSPKGK
jgi:transposase